MKGVIWELFTGHHALLLHSSIALSSSLSLYFCLLLCGCHFLVSHFLSSARHIRSPFLSSSVSSLYFLFAHLLLSFRFECLSSSPVRASKQANSHAALLSQYNEIGSTQIERSHFLQLSTYYRGGTDLFQYL